MDLTAPEDVGGGGPEFVLGAVVVDGDTDVVPLDEALEAGENFRCGRGDEHADAGAPGVVELAADVVGVVLWKGDDAGGVELDAGAGVGGECLGFGGGIGGEVVLDVLGVEGGEVELLHGCDELGTGEFAKGVAGEAEPEGWRSGCCEGAPG